jgi:hypothetical protein
MGSGSGAKSGRGVPLTTHPSSTDIKNEIYFLSHLAPAWCVRDSFTFHFLLVHTNALTVNMNDALYLHDFYISGPIIWFSPQGTLNTFWIEANSSLTGFALKQFTSVNTPEWEMSRFALHFNSIYIAYGSNVTFTEVQEQGKQSTLHFDTKWKILIECYLFFSAYTRSVQSLKLHTLYRPILFYSTIRDL